jgi:hypothetical protein
LKSHSVKSAVSSRSPENFGRRKFFRFRGNELARFQSGKKSRARLIRRARRDHLDRRPTLRAKGGQRLRRSPPDDCFFLFKRDFRPSFHLEKILPCRIFGTKIVSSDSAADS